MDKTVFNKKVDKTGSPGASEVNGIDNVVDDTVDGIVIDALAFVK